MSGYVLEFEQIEAGQLARVGGKGAHLAELSRIDGIRVPAGFCITTEAFRQLAAPAPGVSERLERLARLKLEQREAIAEICAELRRLIEAVAIPDALSTAIHDALRRLGQPDAYAVRSSATAEDSPTASFAGQQDTYLNVPAAGVIEHVRRCWASLFTERAALYRAHHGIDHRKVQMAVVVQRMVFPQAAGILFTADPVSGHRKVCSIEASFGLGEALVSGLVNADVFKVRDDALVERVIADKRLVVQPAPGGGTERRALAPQGQAQPALSDAQAVQLARLGRRIEAHFGAPQDIEWCLSDGDFQFVQSRPITTLYPIPELPEGGKRVYISVGHQQMMTDALKPLGLSFFQMIAGRAMYEAGSRLFVEVSQTLASPAQRTALLRLISRSEPLIADALETVLASGFIREIPDENPGAAPARTPPAPLDPDPALVAKLVERCEASIAASKRALAGKSGAALLDGIEADIPELRRILTDPESYQALMTGIEASWWLNEHLEAWLGEKNAADTLTLSVASNVTSEMGLALLDVADVIRPYPELVSYLERVEHDDFLDELPKLAGGTEARDAIRAWLDRYGARGVGEIDITRPRWAERPSMLLPLLLANIKNFAPGAAARRVEQGRAQALNREHELLTRLRALPEGEQKAAEVKRQIERLRTFIGYREYPKFGVVKRYFVYKQALLAEAERLLQAGVLRAKEDIEYLTFAELQEVVRAGRVDEQLIRSRREAFRADQMLTPPRVLTSEGLAIAGAHRRTDLPAGALIGLPVSAGVVEGRARVILSVADARLETGDILVTKFTDPSWTPIFLTIRGLITEIGGFMTHGAVIAREYGLPAVVGIENATRRIRDGQRVRVDATSGTVELID